MRAVPRTSGRTITGYAIMWDRLSKNLGGFIERVDRHAVSRDQGRGWPGLGGAGVVARYNHDDGFVLGATASGTLRLTVDDLGLRFDVEPPKTREDIVELISRGDVRKTSFAFILRDDTWSITADGYPVRTLRDVALLDVSPVTVPAYEDTSTALRSLAVRLDMPEAEVRAMARRNGLGAYVKRLVDAPTRRIESTRDVTPADYQLELARKRVAA